MRVSVCTVCVCLFDDDDNDDVCVFERDQTVFVWVSATHRAQLYPNTQKYVCRER